MKTHKWMAVAGTILIGLSISSPSFAAAKSYNDMQSNWALENVSDASGLGIFHGYADGGFHPDDSITRAEFVTALVRTMDGEAESVQETLKYPDVKPGDWFYPYVEMAGRDGIIVDGDFTGDFGPSQPISRAEMARMVVRAVAPYTHVPDTQKTFTDVKQSSPLSTFIGQAAGDEIITGYGDGTFKPDQDATRAEAAVMIVRALKVMPQQGPYNIRLQGIDNAAGPDFAIHQVLGGVRDLFNYKNSTDFTPLSQFADPAVVQQLQELFQQFATNNPGMMLVPDGSPLIPKFISRTTAVVKQENVTLFKRSPQGKSFSGEFAVMKNVTWYLKFYDGKWQIDAVDNFVLPDTWQKITTEMDIPPHIDYGVETKTGMYFGTITMSPKSESFVAGHLTELFQNAGADKVTIYAIGGHEVGTTAWADQVKQLQTNPPQVDHTGNVRFVAYDNANHELSFLWFPKDQLAAGFYSAFTNLNQIQIVDVDGVSWAKIWNQSIWVDLIKKETYSTIYSNAPNYQTQIQTILQEAK